MFKIDTEANAIVPLKTRTFGELGFRERSNLQEWIAKHPHCLGEELLIIQKEFAGFSETNERLDLLAIDKQGSLVLIENKLDDTGRDVTWQALKYASYCAGLSKEQVRRIFQEYIDRTQPGADARNLLAEFLEEDDYEEIIVNKGVTQRIMLIAANFRKEVTSTVLWLLNFKLRVQCFKVTPYSMGEQHFLSIEQIIPTKDVEEFMIGINEKARDEVEGVAEEKNRHRVRREFWAEALPAMNSKSTLFQNISPGTSSWIAAGSGMRGVLFNLVAGRAYARAELYIDRGDRDENKFIFDTLFSKREAIEHAFGMSLNWERLDERRASRIKAEKEGNIFDRNQWPAMIEFMTNAMVKMEATLREPLTELGRVLRSRKEN
ncbi:MAG: hypothetical protein BGP06_19625 [Rhizobiales bacterium 65-9]|jgi:hypothetical protein|nr:DUF4268 domain-containing protein [Hyphomicrobiales bacterium]OJY37066.1 MAG: hypothetical protein BGP06_19625 [Rhizobiales bacterium 65-9]